MSSIVSLNRLWLFPSALAVEWGLGPGPVWAFWALVSSVVSLNRLAKRQASFVPLGLGCRMVVSIGQCGCAFKNYVRNCF